MELATQMIDRHLKVDDGILKRTPSKKGMMT
jgi:hypothetical protein